MCRYASSGAPAAANAGRPGGAMADPRAGIQGNLRDVSIPAGPGQLSLRPPGLHIMHRSPERKMRASAALRARTGGQAGLLPDTSCTPRGTTGLWPLPSGRPVPATAGGLNASVDWFTAHAVGRQPSRRQRLSRNAERWPAKPDRVRRAAGVCLPAAVRR